MFIAKRSPPSFWKNISAGMLVIVLVVRFFSRSLIIDPEMICQYGETLFVLETAAVFLMLEVAKQLFHNPRCQ